MTKELTEYFNLKGVCGRKDYTQEEAERYLLAFFEKQGGAIVESVEDLRQITAKNNEVDFYIGKFILDEYEKKTDLMEYIVQLVKVILLRRPSIYRQKIRISQRHHLRMLHFT